MASQSESLGSQDSSRSEDETPTVDIKEGFWHTKICATFNRKFKRKIVISYF